MYSFGSWLNRNMTWQSMAWLKSWTQQLLGLVKHSPLKYFTVLTLSSSVASSSHTNTVLGCCWKADTVHMWLTPSSMALYKAKALWAPVMRIITWTPRDRGWQLRSRGHLQRAHPHPAELNCSRELPRSLPGEYLCHPPQRHFTVSQTCLLWLRFICQLNHSLVGHFNDSDPLSSR